MSSSKCRLLALSFSALASPVSPYDLSSHMAASSVGVLGSGEFVHVPSAYSVEGLAFDFGHGRAHRFMRRNGSSSVGGGEEGGSLLNVNTTAEQHRHGAQTEHESCCMASSDNKYQCGNQSFPVLVPDGKTPQSLVQNAACQFELDIKKTDQPTFSIMMIFEKNPGDNEAIQCSHFKVPPAKYFVTWVTEFAECKNDLGGVSRCGTWAVNDQTDNQASEETCDATLGKHCLCLTPAAGQAQVEA